MRNCHATTRGSASSRAVVILATGALVVNALRSAEMGAANSRSPDARGAATVAVAPSPEGEALSEHYALTVGGQAVPVYSCRVSAVPLNQVWPGYQRPLDQSELAGFATWDMGGPARVEIESRRPLQSVVVRPSGLGLKATVDGSRISFDLDRPRHLVVEVNGPNHALHLFASPPYVHDSASAGEDVRVFGPGIHRPGRIELKSNQSVIIAAGAVVYGSIHAQGASNISVRGRGILDVGPFKRGEGGGAIRFSDCTDVTIEGIVMRDPDVWCCSLFGCRNVTVADVKLVGLWRYNADGIDVCNSQDVVVRDCFVRAFDDALVVKGLKFGQGSFDGRPVKNVRFSRCVIWCDWGRAMEIGAETCAPEITDVVFEDCDVVRTTHIAMDIQHGDRAAVHDVRFEGIRVEMDERALPPRMQKERDERYDTPPGEYLPRLMVIVIRGTNYSKDGERGTVRNVRFSDISVSAPRMPESVFSGSDAQHAVEGVTIEGLRLNGRDVLDLSEARITVGPHAADVVLGNAGRPGDRAAGGGD